MNQIILQPDGLIADSNQTVTSDLLPFLGYQVALTKNYTLRSYFKMLEQYPVLARLSPFLPHYMEQFRQSPSDSCLLPDVNHLQFSKTIEMIGFPGKPRLDIYHALRAVIDGAESKLTTDRLDCLLDLPLTLGKLKHVVFGDQVDEFIFDTVFSLFEFVDGIVWELSFRGAPQACELRR